jgi:hypothetical protein
VVFWKPNVEVGEQAAFQLSLTAPSTISISSLPITSLAVEFSSDILPVTIRHVESEVTGSSVRRIELGHITTKDDVHEIEGHLRWHPGDTIVFSGVMSSDTPRLLKVCFVVLSRHF